MSKKSVVKDAKRYAELWDKVLTIRKESRMVEKAIRNKWETRRNQEFFYGVQADIKELQKLSALYDSERAAVKERDKAEKSLILSVRHTYCDTPEYHRA